MRITTLMTVVLIAAISLFSQETIDLPSREVKLGTDVLEAMSMRKSTREYSPNTLDIKELSTILWSAYGINREESGKKTVPVAMGVDYGRVYVFDSNGVWRFEPEKERLLKVLDGDKRDKIAKQGFVEDAPVILLLAADLDEYSLLKGAVVSHEHKVNYAHATAGCMTQNIALTGEALGIGSVMVAWFDADDMSQLLDFDKDEIPLYLIPLGKYITN